MFITVFVCIGFMLAILYIDLMSAGNRGQGGGREGRLRPPRMRIISGRVLDELGVTVWALQTRYFQGRRGLVPTGGNARTDITGQYRLLSLPPGDYVVMGTSRETWPLDSDPKRVFG